jgi:nitrogenase molybdenum-iron protein NifN
VTLSLPQVESVPSVIPDEEVPVSDAFTTTRNACKVCSPLGAAVVIKGIQGAVPLLHGSQGCATYIRRYLISHFRDPVDIGSSNFSESAAVFGGAENLTRALANMTRQYAPSLIGVATTCLAETIGDDVASVLRTYHASNPNGPQLVHISTPAYAGTHMDGYHAALLALARHFAPPPSLPVAQPRSAGNRIAVFAPFVSPADLRYLREILADFHLPAILLPDYADTLDGPAWADYQTLPAGGAPVETLELLSQARTAIEFTSTLPPQKSPAHYLTQTHAIPAQTLPLPIGLRFTDSLFDLLSSLAGISVPATHAAERGRLVDSYVDAHKYLSGRRAVIFGEEDLVVALASFCAEIGVTPVLCVTGGRSGRFSAALDAALRDCPGWTSAAAIHKASDDADFAALLERAAALQPDFLLGSSKGYAAARALKVPLVRVGFPIHDRFGGQRLLHLGYRGTQQLLDRITNTLLEHRQETSDVGYAYM